MKHTQSAGGVVLNKKGEVLVVSQRGTSWSLPKGHIDKGEDALGAAKREIYEESGSASDARATFQRLVTDYPNSPYRSDARQKIPGS